MGSVEAVFEGFDRAAQLIEIGKAGIELAFGGRLVRVVELQGAKLRAKLEAAEAARLCSAPAYTLEESRKRLEAIYQRD